MEARIRMAKIVFWCQDVVGECMAGCAIRYFELAISLSKMHEVVFFAPGGENGLKAPFKILKKTYYLLFQELDNCCAILTQEVDPILAFLAKAKGVRLIVDAYVPMILEHLEIFKHFSSRYKNYKHEVITNLQIFSFRMADFVLCASEEQKNLWTGMLLALNLIQPDRYFSDSTLKHYIDLVPFGISSNPPKKIGPGLREKYGLKPEDKVLLWGGGIWNWFDPQTLIKAIKRVLEKRSNVYLVFLGLKHPNPKVPEMSAAIDAIALAKNLNLYDQHIFFNFGWTPYQERQNFLMDADIGVSTHLNHLETRFAFRTRILDYIWAGLPIICSEGDHFSKLVQSHKLGEVVPCQDEVKLSEAILTMLESDENHLKIKERLKEISPNFYWEKVSSPISEAISRFSREPKAPSSFNEVFEILRMFFKMKGPEKLIKKIVSLIGS